MTTSLRHVIELINSTGDRCVVLDAEGRPAYVLLSFEQYQQLLERRSAVVGMTERELMEKINRDIADWKGSQAGQLDVQIAEKKPQQKSGFQEAKYSENSLNQAENRTPADQYDFEPIE